MEYLAGGTVADAMRVGAVTRAGGACAGSIRPRRRWTTPTRAGSSTATSSPQTSCSTASRSLHVADFGIARLESEDTITSTGELFGTAAYLAPEQALGREATGASDRYALAVAAFELLTGEPPVHGLAVRRSGTPAHRGPAAGGERVRRTLPPAVDEVLWPGDGQGPRRPLSRRPACSSMCSMPRCRADQTADHPGARPKPRAAWRRHHGGVRRARAAASTPPPSAAIAARAAAARSGGSSAAGPAVAPSRADVRAGPATPARLASLARHGGGATRARSAQLHRGPSASSTGRDQRLRAAGAGRGHNDARPASYPPRLPPCSRRWRPPRPRSLTHAYAQYDLGRSLVLSGNPRRPCRSSERLRIPNQTSLVSRRSTGRARRPGPSRRKPAREGRRGKAPGEDQGQDHGQAPRRGQR